MRLYSLITACMFLFLGEASAETPRQCDRCEVASNGPAAYSKEVVIRALPSLQELQKRCPVIQRENTMVLSPYRVEDNEFYRLQFQFLFGGAADQFISLSTLYTSYFVYADNPLEPIFLVNYLAFRNSSWAERIQKGFSSGGGGPDSVAFSAGRYVVLLHASQHEQSKSCLENVKDLFSSNLLAAASSVGSEEPSEGPLMGLLFVQGTIFDTHSHLTSEQLAELQKHRDTLFALFASEGLTAGGSEELRLFPNLEILSLGPTPLSPADLETIGSLSKLRSARLGDGGITDKMLAPLSKLEQLQSLSLRGNPITSKGIATLSGLPELIFLGLARTKIDDAAVKDISKFSTLRWLFIDDTSVTDEGIKHLASLKDLQYLSLSNCPVSDKSIDVLLSLPALKTVVTRGTRMSNEGRLKLIQQLRQK